MAEDTGVRAIVSGGMFQSINPATGAPGATHPEHTDAEVETRVARAHAFWAEWRTTDLKTRTDLR